MRHFSDRMRRSAGPLLTVLLVCFLELLPPQRLPALPLILMLAIGYSILMSGVGSGLVSSCVAIAYAVYYYRSSGAPFQFSSVNLERLVIFVLATAFALVTLGQVKRRIDYLLVRERDLRRLAESERERMIRILESITDGFFAVDRQWRYTYVNTQAELLINQKGQVLLGKSIWAAFPALVGSTWDREFHQAVEQNISVHFEEYYPPLDTWFETQAYPSQDGLTIYIRSINARKHAEQELHTRIRQQEAVAILGQQALIGGDLETLMNLLVRTMASTLDVELVKVLELLPDGQELVMRAGLGWNEGVEYRMAAKEGSQAGYTLTIEKPVIVTDLATESRFRGPKLLTDHGVVSGMSVIISGHGRPFGILGAHSRKKRTFTVDDIHFLQAVSNILAEAIGRKRSEQSLAESEHRFRQLSENVQEVFYINELQPAQVLYVSPAYEKVWGRSCESLYKSPNSRLEAIHPEDRPYVEKNLADRGFFDGEYRVVLPDGAIHFIRDRASQVFDDRGHPYRVVGIAEDVTNRHVAEEAARRLAESEASVRTRDQVLAVVAHDLRNPLSAISMAATLLGKAHPPTDTLEFPLRAIKRAVDSAERLVRDLLDVTQMEAGQLTVEARALDVAFLLSEARNAVLHLATEKSIALEVSIRGNMPPISGDFDRIIQVLGNLLGNAIKFSPSCGRILLRAQQCADGVEFSVEDEGPGIAPEALPYVFDRFWRARPASPKGLGLGLAIVKGIVNAHHGRVWAESAVGKGSIFHFIIPMDVSQKKEASA